MKKNITVTFLLLSLFVWAQQQKIYQENLQYIDNSVELSRQPLLGSARSVAVGGAWTAIGGDLSASYINPASGAVASATQLGFTLALMDQQNKTTLRSKTNNNGQTLFNIAQGGMLFVFNSPEKGSSFKQFAISVNMQRTNNLKQNIATPALEEPLGETTISKVDTPQEKYPAQIYFDGQDETQKGSVHTMNISFSTNIEDRFYLGVGFNGYDFEHQHNLVSSVRITSSKLGDKIQEDTPSTLGMPYKQKGTGFSFALGGIVKLNDIWRLGLAFESPVWWNDIDRTNEKISINAPPRYVDSRWHVTTPYRLSLGTAIVLPKTGFLSLDYTYRDYTYMSLSPNRHFNLDNKTIKGYLKAAHALALGAEFRLSQDWFLRAGYRWESSPYNKVEYRSIDDKLHVFEKQGALNGFSLGLGYVFENVRLDAAYKHTIIDLNNAVYTELGKTTQYLTPAQTKRKEGLFVLSAVFRL